MQITDNFISKIIDFSTKVHSTCGENPWNFPASTNNYVPTRPHTQKQTIYFFWTYLLSDRVD